MNKHHLLSLFSATLLLTACGGGGDDAPPPPPPPPGPTEAVPASASMSAVGLKDYLVALSTAAADDKEPLALTTFMPVQPEDTEPEMVN